MRTIFTLAASTLLFTIAVGCSHPSLPVPQSPQLARNDHSYLDLQPGMTLRVIVPLLKSSDSRTGLSAEQVSGNTISLNAGNLIGYTSSTYAVTGKPDRVRLQFVSAQQSRDGKTEQLQQAPPLPFDFPKHPARIRLIFLVRVSEADHNMAIVSARKSEVLTAFTARLKQDPAVCGSDPALSCTWVPPGIAVRAEGAAAQSR